ncbi:MAG: hypothetical protein U0694_02045 [Anaerolineae bacterium]
MLDIQGGGRGGPSYTLSVGREKFAISRDVPQPEQSSGVSCILRAAEPMILVVGVEPL